LKKKYLSNFIDKKIPLVVLIEYYSLLYFCPKNGGVVVNFVFLLLRPSKTVFQGMKGLNFEFLTLKKLGIGPGLG
jgi:hypothetical protein